VCDAGDSFLDEIVLDNAGRREFICSDSDYCQARVAQGFQGSANRVSETVQGEQDV